MSRSNVGDSQFEENELAGEPLQKSTEIQADSVVSNRENQKLYDGAALLGNQDSPSEQFIKALDPDDSIRLSVEANRFELVENFPEPDEPTKSELELKAIAKETKDPVLQVIKALADFISILAKSDPSRGILNNLRRVQQTERINELAALSPPLALAAPEHLELPNNSIEKASPGSTEFPPSLLSISLYPGVSQDFQARVKNFAGQIPKNLQQALVKNQVGIVVYANSSQVPSGIAEEHARGHSADQNNKNLPMFYDVRYRTITFIEKPDLTVVEKSWKDKVEHTREVAKNKGVQDFGPLRDFDAKDIRYDPIERNGWHELGHAIDMAVLHEFSQRAEFDKAYKADLSMLPVNARNKLFYYVTPEQTIPTRHQYDRAKRELFAQLFAVALMPSTQLVPSDSKLKELFPRTTEIIKNLNI